MKDKSQEVASSEFPECKWTEFSHTTHREVPPLMITLEQLDELKAKYRHEDCYTSIFRYSGKDPNIGSLLSGFPLDFDDRENPERARKEACIVVADLMDRLGIPEQSISICFTGSKGFAIFVNRRIFGIQPSERLPLILKSMALELKENLGLKTLDLKVYHRRALWRLPNTRHPKSSLYKVEMTNQELEKFSIDEIKELARKPRAIKRVAEHKLIPEAQEWYLKHAKLVERWFEDKEERFVSTNLSNLPTVPCVAKRLQVGSEEGNRNNTLFQLAVYFARSGKSIDETTKTLLDLNQRNKPPLQESEVMGSIESAYKGVREDKYSVGCGSEAFHEFCDKEHCPFFTKGDSGLISATPEMKTEAMKRLESPNLEEWTLQTYHQDIVGEDNNILAIHYLLLTGKQKDPKLKQIIVLKGDPAGGKTTLADQISRSFKRKKVGRFTEHALDYSDMTGREVLYLQEILGLGKEESGVSTLRFLSADDEGYLVEAATRDESGKFRTQQYSIPPITVITTTSHVSIEKQLGRRTWELNADQSPEQTIRILDVKAQREVEKFGELMGLQQPRKDKEILQCAINLLEPIHVIIPFPKTLKTLFERFKGVLRVRSDYDKFMTLVRMRCFWFQKQRKTVITTSGEKIVFATLDDAIRALEIASQSLTQMLTEMEKRVLDAIPIIKELVMGYVVLGKTKDGTDEAYQGFRYKEFMKKTGFGERRAKEILDDLVEKGILAVNQPKGRTKIFELAVSSDELDEKLKVSRSWLQQDTLQSELEKEQESFFSTLLRHATLERPTPSLGKQEDRYLGVAAGYDISKQDFEHSGEKEPELSRSDLERDTLRDSNLEETPQKAAKEPLAKLDETTTKSQTIILCRNHVFQLGWYEKHREGKAEIRGLTKQDMESLRCRECGDTPEFEVTPA